MDKSIEVLLAWMKNRTDTLLIVTADHETGGLTIQSDEGKGQYPQILWAHTGHTAASVPVFAIGKGADKISGKLDNTDIFKIMNVWGLPQ